VEPYPHAYSLLASEIEYVHVKDVRYSDPSEADDGMRCRYHDGDREYTTTWLGSGAVNWTGLIGRLISDGYDGPLTLEPHARLSCREAALAHGTSWLRDWIERSKASQAAASADAC